MFDDVCVLFIDQENLEKTEEEKKMMNEEKSKLDTEISKWEKNFEKQNGRKPTDDDKYVCLG